MYTIKVKIRCKKSDFFFILYWKIGCCLIFDNLESEMWKMYWLFVKKSIYNNVMSNKN